MQTRPFLTLAHLAALLLLLVAGCGEDQVRQHAKGLSRKIIAWGLIQKRDDTLVLHRVRRFRPQHRLVLRLRA